MELGPSFHYCSYYTEYHSLSMDFSPLVDNNGSFTHSSLFIQDLSYAKVLQTFVLNQAETSACPVDLWHIHEVLLWLPS